MQRASLQVERVKGKDLATTSDELRRPIHRVQDVIRRGGGLWKTTLCFQLNAKVVTTLFKPLSACLSIRNRPISKTHDPNLKRLRIAPRRKVKYMKCICIRFCLLVFTATATIGLAARAAAQIIVVGTGDPKVDVPAVQAAVDQGGEVILKGHLSFDREPTVPTALEGFPKATVLVSKAVTISGTREENGADGDGEMTSIDAGTIPFYVEAPGASVTIEALRFIRPSADAILVYAVSGLTMCPEGS